MYQQNIWIQIQKQTNLQAYLLIYLFSYFLVGSYLERSNNVGKKHVEIQVTLHVKMLALDF